MQGPLIFSFSFLPKHKILVRNLIDFQFVLDIIR